MAGCCVRGWFVVHPSVPTKTAPELIAYAKANPGKLNFGEWLGAWKLLLVGEFKMMSGVDMIQCRIAAGHPR